jgi:hypothetical protein
MMSTKLQRALLWLAVTPLLIVGILPITGATPPSGPVTIVTTLDFSTFPPPGTFEVTEGHEILGCSSGTTIDFPRGVGAVERVFTCDAGNGQFTFLFLDRSNHWQAWKGTEAFYGIRGQGEFSIDFMNDTDTITGLIHFNP